MTDDVKPQVTEQDLAAAKEGLESLLGEAHEEQQKRIESEAAKKSAESLKNLGVFATKDEVANAIKQLIERQKNFEALLLRAKERGEANLSQKDTDSEANLKKIYEGTGLFD